MRRNEKIICCGIGLALTSALAFVLTKPIPEGHRDTGNNYIVETTTEATSEPIIVELEKYAQGKAKAQNEAIMKTTTAAVHTTESETTTEAETTTEEETTTEAPTATSWVPYDFIPLSYEVQFGIKSACDRYGIAYDFLLALFKQESNFNQGSIGDNGKAYGLGQIREEYWSETANKLGLYDWKYDAVQNAELTCAILARHYFESPTIALNIYRSGTTQDTVEPNGKTYVQIIYENYDWIQSQK